MRCQAIRSIKQAMCASIAVLWLWSAACAAQNAVSSANDVKAAKSPSGASSGSSKSKPAAAQDAPLCSAIGGFEAFRSAYIATHGQTLAAPATMIIPSGWNARILFRQPIGGDAEPRSFHVFEVDDPNPARMKAGAELSLFAIDQAPDNVDSRFKPTDSVSLRVEVPRISPPWLNRSFVVVACKADIVSGWGVVTAPVSNRRVTLWICVVFGILVYCFAMTSVFIQRSRPSAFAAKYPAVYGVKQLRPLDFINPIHLVANAFNQGSVQKAQVLLFSFLVGELVLSTVLNTGALVEISQTVVALLGISGVGATAAQLAYTQKTRLSFENWAWLEKRGVLQHPVSPAGPFWRDLVLTNREFDVYKLQTIIFTAAVASALIVGGASHLSTFSIPETLLGVLGLSQVIYVGGVLARPSTVADLDDSLTKLRAADDLIKAARAQGTDIDNKQKLILPPPAGIVVAQNAQSYRQDLAETVAAMIESALEVEVDVSKL